MSELLLRLAQQARTVLFVPGDRSERFDKAVASGADLVVLDLEDAVAPEDKEDARSAVAEALDAGMVCGVRVNAAGTPWHEHDVAMLSGRPAVVMLPKADGVAALDAIRRLGDAHPVLALVETARGVLAAVETATTPGVCRLAFGSFDLAAELGVSPDDRDAMAPARGVLVLASAAAGLPGPIDGVTGAVRDADALDDDVHHARRLGMTGKLCIHPAQVAGAERGLRPTADEVDWARGVVASAAEGGGGAGLLDGRMVDKPVLDRARRILAAEEGPR